MSILQKFFTRKCTGEMSAKSKILLFAVLIFVLVLTFCAAVLLGSTNINAVKTLFSFFSPDKTSADYRIIFYVRLPRAAAAVLAGSALAVSGVIIQAVLNNAMAAPNIIGVNAGAGLFVVTVIAIAPAAVFLIPVAAFAGALSACLLIYAISAKTGASRITITLVGIAVSSVLTSGINAVKVVFPDSVYNLTSFTVGGLSGVNISVLKYAVAGIIVCIAAAIIMSKDIDVLSLGEDTAFSLGMNVAVMRFVLLVIASILAGCAVSFAGLLGFVGLVVPHIVRRYVGTRHTLLVPVSALCGAEFVLICDIISRIMFRPYEIPVGIILSFIGGFFFIALILMQRKQKIYD